MPKIQILSQLLPSDLPHLANSRPVKVSMVLIILDQLRRRYQQSKTTNLAAVTLSNHYNADNFRRRSCRRPHKRSKTLLWAASEAQVHKMPLAVIVTMMLLLAWSMLNPRIPL